VIITLFTQHVATNMMAMRSVVPPMVESMRPGSPEMQAAMKAMVSNAGTEAVNEVMMILFFATAALILFIPILPSRKKLVAMFKHHPGGTVGPRE
jgi:hypothetical protein